MVTIIDYKACVSQEGKEFFALILQGDLSMVQSESGNLYLTANKVAIATSLNENMCKAVIGKTLTGSIQKVACEPYEYVNKETGETIMLSHKFQYSPEEVPVNQHQEVNSSQIPKLNQISFGSDTVRAAA